MIEFDLKYFEMARDWNVKFFERLKKQNLHCRGNLKSVSLISLNYDTPERGFSNIKSEKKLLELLSELEQCNNVIEKPKRPTPEKLLQATIINEAIYQNEHYLKFGNKIKFVTSEFAMKYNDAKMVNDILGFSDDGNLYVIELKSSRNKKELEEQVKSFTNFIKANEELFFNLLNLYGCKWDKRIIKKAVVWNKLNDKKVFCNDIQEFVYDKVRLEKDKILFIEELK